MIRWTLILLAVLIFCALSIVTSQHNARRRNAILHQEQKFAHELDVEWGKLRLEQGTWSMHARIEAEASRRLLMHIPTSKRIQIVLRREEGEAYAY